MNKEPMGLFGPGDTFKEFPGCKHRICANASETEEAAIFAVFVIDTSVLEEVGPAGMVVLDEEWREIVEKVQIEKWKQSAQKA